MKPDQNIIYTSTFNIDYESEASAVRCNILIESILGQIDSLCLFLNCLIESVWVELRVKTQTIVDIDTLLKILALIQFDII